MDMFISSGVLKNFLDLIMDLLESGGIDAMILQDYDKGVLAPRVISRADRGGRKGRCSGIGRPEIQKFSPLPEGAVVQAQL